MKNESEDKNKKRLPLDMSTYVYPEFLQLLWSLLLSMRKAKIEQPYNVFAKFWGSGIRCFDAFWGSFSSEEKGSEKIQQML